MSSNVPKYVTKPIHESHILVVDDTNMNRELIVTYLKQEGFHLIETAKDGVEALEKIKSFEPDLVILDLCIPRMSGIEVLHHLRANRKHTQTPILIQTIPNNPQEYAEVWESGASDILIKPINRIELISRIKAQLNNAYLIRELEYYQHMTGEDVAQGLELQQLLLPNQEAIAQLEQQHHITIDSMFIPSRFLSGDLWGLIPLSEQKFAVWIADFAGKGTRAALNTFRLDTLMQEYKDSAIDPSEFLYVLNNRLIPLIPIGQFSTFLLGVIDIEKGIFDYAAASATHPIIYYPSQKKYQIGDASGIPLGVVKDEKYPLRQLSFPPETSLLLYSDLLWEEKAIPGITLLENDIERVVCELEGRSFCRTLREQLQFLEDLSLPDDLTLVEIHRLK